MVCMIFFAHGGFNQIIYMAPLKNVVVVRLGETIPGQTQSLWPLVIHNLVDKLR